MVTENESAFSAPLKSENFFKKTRDEKIDYLTDLLLSDPPESSQGPMTRGRAVTQAETTVIAHETSRRRSDVLLSIRHRNDHAESDELYLILANHNSVSLNDADDQREYRADY